MQRLNAVDMLKKKNNLFSNFFKGYFCPFRTFNFIKEKPGLYKYIIMPFIINVFVFSLVIYLGLGSFSDLVMSRIPQGDAWYWVILNYFLVMIAVLIIVVLVFFSFTVIGSLIASPFNDILSEKTELILTGKKTTDEFSWDLLLNDAGRSMLVELKKISVFLLGMLGLLFLHLIPVIGIFLYPVLSVLWTMLFLVAEYTGYAFSRKRLSFKEQRIIIFKHFSMMTGFGAGLLCLLAIPFMQFLCIPLGVVSAVRLLYEAGELDAD